MTSEGVVIIDTLPFPRETEEMLDFVRRRCRAPIRYVILTHYHADHSYGSCLLPGELIAHERCRRILARTGKQILRADQAQNADLAAVTIRLPETVFDRGSISLHVGRKTITLFHTPGHTADGISAYIKEDKVLFAGDLIMPVPYIVAGDRQAMHESLQQISEFQLDNIVQGHGDVLLRGEIEEAIDTSHQYLDTIEKEVRDRIAQGLPQESLRRVDIERCHKSRIPLSGLVEELHQANLSYLYNLLAAEEGMSAMPVIDNSARA
jgi:glyoxylase-like metal-dependent hydrolase (beta-lactamase superfamily II)